MPRYESCARNANPSGARCAKRYIRAGLVIMSLLSVTGCTLRGRLPPIPSGERRVCFLDANQPAPFAGVLLPEDRYEMLLDYEEAAQDEGLVP